MMLPSWLNYNFAEQQAAILTRGLNNGEVSWGQLIATAETILSYYQELHLSDANVLYNQELAAPLIAAARILDSASQPTTDIPSEHKLKLGLSAAVAFGMHGNFSSAVAVLRRFFDQPEIYQFSNALLGTLLPSYIVKLIPVTEDLIERRYLELLEGFLENGEQSSQDEIRSLFIKNILNSRSDLESSLFRSARLCLEHIFNLSTARVINEYCPLIGNEVIFNLVSSGIVVLLPPQHNAIVENSIFSNRKNLLVALPTSTGKTLISELCLIDSLQEKKGIAAYITPYVALGSQVVRKLESHLPDGFRVHRLIAGIHREEELEPELFNEVIVATPERFDLLIAESPWILDYLRAIAFDEAHIIESGARGIKVEGIISRLRMQQRKGKQFRIILLSAVLDTYDTLKSWLELPDKNLITDAWKPTARRIAIWEDRGYLTWYVGNEEIRQGGQDNNSVIGKMFIPWPFNDIYPTNDRYQKPIMQNDAYSNVAYLVDYLLGAYGGSVMCVCATKAGTRRMAAALRERFDTLEPVPPTLL